MEEIESLHSRTNCNTKFIVLGWPYNCYGKVEAYPIVTYRSPTDIITFTYTCRIPEAKIFYPYCLNAYVRDEPGIILRDGKDFSILTRMWWIPYESGCSFRLRNKDLEQIMLGDEEVGRLAPMGIFGQDCMVHPLRLQMASHSVQVVESLGSMENRMEVSNCTEPSYSTTASSVYSPTGKAPARRLR